MSCGVEKAINDAKWDKRSSWAKLVGQSQTAKWEDVKKE